MVRIWLIGNVGLSFPSSLYLLSSYLEYSTEGKDNQMEQRVNMTIPNIEI